LSRNYTVDGTTKYLYPRLKKLFSAHQLSFMCILYTIQTIWGGDFHSNQTLAKINFG